jgi:hypothetical protein
MTGLDGAEQQAPASPAEQAVVMIVAAAPCS